MHPSDQRVSGPVHHEQWVHDPGCGVLQRQRRRVRPRRVVVRRSGAMAERVARHRGELVPLEVEAVRAGERDPGTQAWLVRHRAGCVVAAEADAEHADPRGVELRPPLAEVHRGGCDLLVGGLDRELVLALSLPWPVDREHGHAAGQEVLGGRLQLLFHRVETRRHDDHGRRDLVGPGGGGDAQVRGQPGVAIGHGDELSRRAEPRCPLREARDGAIAGSPLLVGVDDEDELRPVPAHRRAPPRLHRGHHPCRLLGVTGDRLVPLRGAPPLAAPVLPARDPSEGSLEVEVVGAVVDETGSPVRRGRRHPRVDPVLFGHLPLRSVGS